MKQTLYTGLNVDSKLADINLLHFPLLCIEYITPEPLFANNNYAGILITSRYSIENLNLPKSITDLPIYTVGSKTALIAKDKGFADITVANGNLTSLLDIINIKCKRASNLLYIAGLYTSREIILPNFFVDKVITYKANKVSSFSNEVIEKLRSRDIDKIIITSCRIAENFLSIVVSLNLLDIVKELEILVYSARIKDFLKQELPKVHVIK